MVLGLHYVFGSKFLNRRVDFQDLVMTIPAMVISNRATEAETRLVL